MPKISIITVNYNNALGLKETIESVLGQVNNPFEYIVVDGASNDGSVAVLENYSSQLTQWISEPDTGVYQAMNKGIRAATGDYLLFLNSGDLLHSPSVLKLVEARMEQNHDLYYGNLTFQTKDTSFVRDYPKKLRFSHFIKRSLPHPATFIKRALFDRVFLYSEDYKIVSDWEFFIYALFKTEASYQHFDIIVSKFDLEGMSNDPKNNRVIKLERFKVLQKHFPGFYEDYQKMLNQEVRSEQKDLKLLRQIQQTKTGRRVVIRLLKFLSLFFGTKLKE